MNLPPSRVLKCDVRLNRTRLGAPWVMYQIKTRFGKTITDIYQFLTVREKNLFQHHYITHHSSPLITTILSLSSTRPSITIRFMGSFSDKHISYGTCKRYSSKGKQFQIRKLFYVLVSKLNYSKIPKISPSMYMPLQIQAPLNR